MLKTGLSPDQKEEIVLSYNKLAMEQLQKENFDNSMTYLKQALIAIKNVTEGKLKQRLMAITFNNLGCFFKRSRNFAEALKYLQKSVEFEHVLPSEAGTIAGAYLNMCSIFSQQDEHMKALSCGLKSILLLKTIYKLNSRHVPTLIIAYHNVASEYRMLGRVEEAEDCLKIALQISNDTASPNNSLSRGMKFKLVPDRPRFKTPNYEYFSRLPMSRGRIRPPRPKSRATSEDRQKPMRFDNFLTEPKLLRRRSKQQKVMANYPQHIELQHPFIPTLFNEEDSVTHKSISGISTTSKKLEIMQIREIERQSAIKIQSRWRGYLARKTYKRFQIEHQVKKAETKARKAVEEYERLRNFADKIRPRTKN